MKYTFKQISAIAMGIMTLGLTAGVAAAANYPAPFVSGSQADFAVVHGASPPAAATDMSEATSVANQLLSLAGGTITKIEGDSVLLAKSTDKFNLGDAANAFITTIDGNDLDVVLADGVFRNEENEEYDYTQEISMGSFTLQHFSDSDFNDEEPVIGFDLADGTPVLTYTLDFTPDNAESTGGDWNDFEGQTIEMLGKEYYILSATNGTTADTIELLDSANDGIVNSGETVSVVAGGTSYDVSISFIDSDEVRLTVNGETTPSLNEDDTFKLDSGDYVGIKEISFQNFQGGSQQAEFSIGSGKIELISGSEVKINNEDISDLFDHTLNVTISTSGTPEDLDSIAITWITDEDFWLGYGTDSKSLEMPGFGNIQLSLGDWVTSASEVTSVEPDGDDKVKLKTTVTDGDVDFNILYTNGTTFSIGKDADELLETSQTDAINWTSNSKWFVATWYNGDDHESYVLEVSDIDDTTPADNTTTIKSMATGSNEAVTLDIGDTDEIGEISFTLDGAYETGELANISISSTSGSVNMSQIITAEGLWIQLPYNDPSGTNEGALDGVGADANDTSWTMYFDEEDKDGDVLDGEEFDITIGHNSDNEPTVSSINEATMSGGADLETEDGSDNFVGYIQSDLATMTLFKTGGDQDEIEFTYHGDQAYGEVYLTEVGAVSSSNEELGSVLVTASEVNSVQSRNLVVVGGSCVNSVAATLVGGAYCGSAWTDATGVGSGQFLIESYDSPYASGKVALLVAGYEREDTVNAATYLRNRPEGDVDTTAGMKYTGSTATQASLAVN